MIIYSVTLVFYNFFLLYLIPYLSSGTTADRLGISPAQLTKMTNFQAAWVPLFEKYMNPLTYSDINTRNLNDLYNEIKKYFNAIKLQIKNNPDVKLTVTDYVVLWIHKNLARRKNIPAPTATPGISIINESHLNILFHGFDLAHPTLKKKPKDVLRIGVKILFQTMALPLPTIDQLVEIDDENSMDFDIPFTGDQVDLFGFIAICFKNDSGSGNYSVILPFRVI